ncbi:MAG: YybS family protein, partial [Treponema sp.]|nr:YybS family protein [Treponema sp.]
MPQEDKTPSLEIKAAFQNRESLTVMFVCIAVSLFIMKTGILSFFFLAPLGYAVLVCGSVLATFVCAAGVNIIITLFTHVFSGGNSGSLMMDILYFSTVFFMFIWITGGKNTRTLFRFIIGASAGAAAFFIFIWANRNSTPFGAFLNSMAEAALTVLSSSTSYARNEMTADSVLMMIENVSLRGGALASMLFIFFLNRHIAVTLFLYIKRQKYGRRITEFFAPVNTIWVLSGALAVLILTGIVSVEILEIIAWNVLTVCAIIFLVQGFGIVTFICEKRAPAYRFLMNIVFIFVMLSPLG